MPLPHQFQLFFDWLLRASWQATLLIVLVFLVLSLFRHHISARARYALWLLVAIRLLLPLAPESRFSIYNLTEGETWSASPMLDVAPPNFSPSISSSKPTGNKTISVPLTSWISRIDWKMDFFFIWSAGVLVLSLRLVFRTWFLWFRISRFRPVINSSVLELFEECKEALGVRTPVFLVETSHVRGVALMGFIRPRLLLPQGIFDSLNREELRHVFLHEIGHVKRWDIVTNWVMHLLQILHWFNPAVWIAFARARTDRELACDALVLAEAGTDQKQGYGHTILKLLQSFSVSNTVALPAVVGILEYKNQIKERIQTIAQFTKKSHQWSIAAILVAAIVAVIACTNAKGQNETSLPHASTEALPTVDNYTITKVYWADAADRPQNFSDQLVRMFATEVDGFVHCDGVPLIWLHLTIDGKGNSDDRVYDHRMFYRFMRAAGQGFKLKAFGLPDVPVRTVQTSMTNSTTGVAELAMQIEPEDYRALAVGTPYTLVPDNPSPDYQWEVADGVTLVKH